jgi:hypothetical protein
MNMRNELLEQISLAIGDDFNYYYDSDYIGNQVISENESKYISFLYRPKSKIGVNKLMFESLVTTMKELWPMHDIFGGKVQYLGWMVTLRIRSLEDIENEIKLSTEEYITKMNNLYTKATYFRNIKNINQSNNVTQQYINDAM